MLKKHLYLLQHDATNTAGIINDWLNQHVDTLTATTLRLDQGYNLTPLDPNSIDGLIILDSAASVDDHADWNAAERILIRTCDKRHVPVLGIGFGSCQIARAFSAAVTPVTPINEWRFVTNVDNQQKYQVWQNNHEMWHLPAGAQSLFVDDCQKPQAFTLHEQLVGLQMHFEVTNDILQQMHVPQPINSSVLPRNQQYLRQLLTKLFIKN